jgi:hypothetical protein
MARAIGPVAGDGYHPVSHVPQLPQVLLGGERDTGAALGIAGLIDDQHPLPMGLQPGMSAPERKSLLVERGAVPGRVMQKVMQGLAPRAGHNGGELDNRLVVLPRQQQPNQVLAHGFSFL